MAKPNVISKQELLEAAQTCLAEKGIERITLKAVAEQAKVSQGTVYYHFRTKEQLMIELVQSLCDASWQSMQQSDRTMEEAIQEAKERCDHHSVYHRLFFSSLAASFHNKENRMQLGSMIQQENKYLSEILRARWGQSPVKDISMDQWGIIMNALIDGLAVQALLDEEFPKEDVFTALQVFFDFMTNEVKP
ncbi:TetR/AcrR family transcriptional regulator [Paenibacillus lautus]|uniref:TetR/AcrR family transcriptional regulator n=1 Tax=Paenibacillus lautus TaxID=1401 RepID=A0A385TLT6_PAELA|nr:TetR/AcrR family transcriptional regulator [Paenibacillus lautus]AYB44556.1 TetR/AcrR family transcriptional regulator [Paenibacillus lautus]MCI1776197.1 TetR/AcrR family transcriptional regulator [Paenibacillus lautus]